MPLQITAAIAPSPAPPPTPAPPGGDDDFARQLDHAEARQREPSPPDAATRGAADRPGHGNAATAAGKSSAHEESAQRNAAAARPAPQRNAREAAPAQQAGGDAAKEPHDVGATESAADAERGMHPPSKDDDEPGDAAVPALDLPALIAHRALPQTPAAAGTTAMSTRGAGAARKPPDAGDAAQALAGATAASRSAVDTTAADAATLPRAAADEAGAKRIAVELPATPGGAHAGVEPNRSFAATLQASLPAARAELPAAPGSPQFPAALGAQLSTWVRDGVQQAQLNLNPADLGPIGLRISLDGTQAQVTFQAAHAATRDALEAAMPSLASALHASGFTLSGGGVFQQPKNPHPSDHAEARAGGSAAARGADDAAIAAPMAARAAVPRGIVDLYA